MGEILLCDNLAKKEKINKNKKGVDCGTGTISRDPLSLSRFEENLLVVMVMVTTRDTMWVRGEREREKDLHAFWNSTFR